MISKFFKFIGQIVFITIALLSVFAFWIFLQIPSDTEIKGCLITKMYSVNLCPGSKSYVPLGQISEYMKKAVVVSEDGSFWTHDGFDWKELEKSARENVELGKYKRGGSTISQQLAKNMFLSKDKSLIRKGLEAIITYKMEKVLSKKEILERYLNVIEYGENIYGLKAASNYYFNKQPSQLNLAESAFLTMLLPSPKKYSISFRKKQLTPFAKKRIHRIIRDLFQYHKITEDEFMIGQLDADNIFPSTQESGNEEDGLDSDDLFD